MSIPATIGSNIPIVVVLDDGNTSQYPQAEIYAQGAVSPLITISLTHKSKGRYEGEWLPPNVGVYSALFIIYSDSDHSIENIQYTREVEQIFVSQSSFDDLSAKIVRILGLVHENAFIDNTVFDDSGQLISARIRIFNSKEAVELATDGGVESGGLVATYAIESSYEGECRMSTYRVKRVV